jgi:hypothetical protein
MIRIAFFSIFLLAIIPGCRPQAVKHVPVVVNADEKSQSGIICSLSELSSSEAVAIFSTDPRAYGATVLVLDVTNTTAHSLAIYPSYCDLPRSSGKRLSREYHYDTYQWAMAGGIVAALFYWPAIPFVVVPAAFGMRSYNKKITKDIRSRTFGPHDTIRIAPYEQIRRFVIIPRSFPWRGARLSILDEKTNQLLTFAL